MDLGRLYRRHVPHKTVSGSHWCVPVWLVWLTGGNFDTGNGYGWRPSLYRHIRRYYQQKWYRSYTLYGWVFDKGPSRKRILADPVHQALLRRGVHTGPPDQTQKPG